MSVCQFQKRSKTSRTLQYISLDHKAYDHSQRTERAEQNTMSWWKKCFGTCFSNRFNYVPKSATRGSQPTTWWQKDPQLSSALILLLSLGPAVTWGIGLGTSTSIILQREVVRQYALGSRHCEGLGAFEFSVLLTILLPDTHHRQLRHKHFSWKQLQVWNCRFQAMLLPEVHCCMYCEFTVSHTVRQFDYIIDYIILRTQSPNN